MQTARSMASPRPGHLTGASPWGIFPSMDIMDYLWTPYGLAFVVLVAVLGTVAGVWYGGEYPLPRKRRL